MASNYRNHFSTRKTPQSEPIPGRTDMVQNNAGGFTFAVDDWTRLERFLILGSEAGTYYQSERTLTRENAQCVERLLKTDDGPRVVDAIVDVSTRGRAPKNDAAIFALAMCLKLGDLNTRRAAAGAVSQVCRIGTHLFHLARDIEAFGGWGRGTRDAIASWYLGMDVSKLALQAVKYQQRDGWSHRDLLRLCHAKARDEVRNGLFSYMTKGVVKVEPGRDYDTLRILDGYEKAQLATTPREIVKLIAEYKLPRECIPTQFLNDSSVWMAMLPHMGLTAMIRNLGKMTSIGLIAPFSEAIKVVRSKLTDEDEIRRARLHPLNILMALKTYASGHGLKGSLSWDSDDTIVNALDDAFYMSFGTIEPTGKNYLIGVDISGSMDSQIAGTHLTCREAAAAMAMVIARTEPENLVIGFGTRISKLPINEKMQLDDVVSKMRHWDGGGTDCALPMMLAHKERLAVDIFTVITDNETWAGSMQPVQALRQYREGSGRAAKSAVFGMTASAFTIADPTDAGMMDFVGFDSGALQVYRDFCSDRREDRDIETDID